LSSSQRRRFVTRQEIQRRDHVASDLDPLTGKWIRARYVAELHDVGRRYAERESIGVATVHAFSNA
jgi:hypothetical protein